tara:strand:+ start:38135 stop:38275 length:141 start_codon:yes stop_codon:yes gene_type:complete
MKQLKRGITFPTLSGLENETVKSFYHNFKSHQKAVTLGLDVNLTTN